jgi:hypothetical protein
VIEQHLDVTARNDLATDTMLFAARELSVGPSGGVICGRDGATLANTEGGRTLEDLLGNFLCSPPFAVFQGFEVNPVFHGVRLGANYIYSARLQPIVQNEGVIASLFKHCQMRVWRRCLGGPNKGFQVLALLHSGFRQDLQRSRGDIFLRLEESWSALLNDFRTFELPVPTFRVNDPAVTKVSVCPGQQLNEIGSFPLPDETCYNSFVSVFSVF